MVPVRTKTKQFATEDQVSIDMGQRTFITGLTDDKIIEIGTDMSEQLATQLKKMTITTKSLILMLMTI